MTENASVSGSALTSVVSTQGDGWRESALVDHDPPEEMLRPNFYRLRDIILMFLYHRRIALGGLLLGTIIGVGVLLATHTQYTASSLLIVLIGRESASPPDIAGVAPGSVNIDGLKVLQSEITIVESVDVIEHALQVVGPEIVFPEVARRRMLGLLPPLPPEQQMARAAELTRRWLYGSDSQNASNNAMFNGSNIMRVTLTLPDREVAIRMLQAVVDAYLEQRRQIFANPGSTFLNAELTKVDAQLRGIEAALQKVRVDYHVLNIGQDISLAAARQDALLARESGVRERQQAVQAELASANKQLLSQPQRVFESRDLTNQPTNDDTRNTLLKLQLERAHMVQQYAPTWPAVKELDRKINAVEANIRHEASRPGSYVQREVRNPAVDFLRNRIVSLDVESRALASQLAELDRQYNDAQVREAELRDADHKIHDLERQRDVQENVQRQISLRAASVRVADTVTAAHNANVSVVQAPTAPYTGSFMGYSYLVGMIVAGLTAGIAGTLVASRLRRVFVVSREVERALLLPVLGEFATADKLVASPAGRVEIANLAAILMDDPAITRKLALGQPTLLQVTGLEQTATTGLAEALASELAEHQGLRTLFIDVTAPGTTGATTGLTPSTLPNLWTVTVSPLSLQGRSRDLPANLSKAADIVVIACPGSSRDNAVRRLARIADASIMVVVAEKTQSEPARDLRDAVLAAGGRIAGFAFTGRYAVFPGLMQRWT